MSGEQASTPFKYDVFISYAHRDGAWATRLVDSLERRGLSVFVDRTRLTPGVEWSPQLQDAIEQSQHLVALWSDEPTSDWVVYEISAFMAAAGSDAEQRDPPRHLIPVYLSGTYRPLNRFQHVDVIRRSGAYEAGVDAVSDDVWDGLVDQIAGSIEVAEVARRVRLLVVTTTRDALSKVSPSKPLPPPPLEGESLASLVKRLGLRSRKQLLESYGTDRGDWRPFGSEKSVKGILNQLKDDINGQLRLEGLRPFRWDYLDDDVWGGASEVVMGQLAREPAVVVLDPVSLYDEQVKWMTSDRVFPAIRENEHALVIILPPFELPNAAALRDSIKGLASEVFDSHYKRPVYARRRYARYLTSVGDVLELKAGLLAGIGPVLASRGDEQPVPYL